MKALWWRRGALVVLVLSVVLLLPASNRIPRDVEAPVNLGRKSLAAPVPGPYAFIPNRGQRGAESAYYAQGPGYTLDFGENGVQMVAAQATLRVDFVGARAVRPAGEAPSGAQVNVFLGNDPERWRTGLPAYRQLRYADLYPGVDLYYALDPGILKYTFRIEPGGDVSQIQLRYRDTDDLWIGADGVLHIPFAGGELRDSRPTAYQEIDGERIAVAVHFTLYGPRTCGFSVADDYDPRYPLVIDPTLDYGTYLGGSSAEQGNDIAVDDQGFIYVVSTTGAGDFPTKNAYQGYRGYSDVVIAKIDPSKSGTESLVYATYLGGIRGDAGEGIVVDDAGNVLVTGFTQSADLPTTSGAYDTACGTDGDCNKQGGNYYLDAFFAKLSADGSALLYSTYFGGSSSEVAYGGIAVDGDVVFLAGYTWSPDLPATEGAYDRTCGTDGDCNYDAGSDEGYSDIFVARFDLTQAGPAALTYATYLGGSAADFAYDLAVDSTGNAYVGGFTESTDAPTQNAYQSDHAVGDEDVYIAKLDPTGSHLLYATFLGGSGIDSGWHLAVDDAGNVYQTGETSSSDFPTPNAYQDSYNYNKEAFLARIDTTQSGNSSLVYATFLGGVGIDVAHGIAHNIAKRVYVTGWTTSPDFPTTPYAYDTTCGTDGTCNYDTYRRSDAFVAEIDTAQSGTASLLQSTFLGGSDQDMGYSVATDGSGTVYVTGMTESTDFPTANAYDTTCGTDGLCNPGDIIPYASDVFLAVLSARPDLSTSRKQVSPTTIASNGAPTRTLAYTLTLANTGDMLARPVYLTDTLPPSLTLAADPVCTSGACGYQDETHIITWTGSLSPSVVLTLTYTGFISVSGDTSSFIINTARIDDGVNSAFTIKAFSAVNPRRVYLPLVQRGPVNTSYDADTCIDRWRFR